MGSFDLRERAPFGLVTRFHYLQQREIWDESQAMLWPMLAARCDSGLSKVRNAEVSEVHLVPRQSFPAHCLGSDIVLAVWPSLFTTFALRAPSQYR